MSSPNFSLVALIDKVSCAYKKRVHCTISNVKKLKHNYGVNKLNIVCRRNSSADYRVSSRRKSFFCGLCVNLMRKFNKNMNLYVK